MIPEGETSGSATKLNFILTVTTVTDSLAPVLVTCGMYPPDLILCRPTLNFDGLIRLVTVLTYHIPINMGIQRRLESRL